MKAGRSTFQSSFRPILAALLAILCGGILWSRLGEKWSNASYDYLFRFATRSVPNNVVLIQMDNEAFSHEPRQERRQPWDRQLHARLLARLAADNCPLVVFDSFFGSTNNAESD